ncbi:MAG: T9SS type A sorting domain-containing protein [Bacteroidetes bacterium]|nr:T9SS type A sorting domain-containing protein [Bacteroidota bacterium]
MRKLLTLTFVSLFCGLSLGAQELPGLLFTEFSVTTNAQAGYYELTNMEDTAIDLRDFILRRYIHSEKPLEHGPLEGQFVDRCKADFSLLLDSAEAHLEPGESFTIMPVSEARETDKTSFLFGQNQTRPGSRDSADYINYRVDWNWDVNQIRIEMGWEKDSAFIDLLVRPTPKENTYLYWKDTIAVDAIINLLDAGGRATPLPNFPIAGIDNSTDNYVHVRKSTIKKSTLDWDISRGIDASDSEWMTIFQDHSNPWNPSFFTTIGTHGDFSIDFSSAVLTIDHTAKTITVPWGIRKGTFNVELSPSKGLIDEIDFGPGMAYLYNEQSDSASSACMLGDTLWVYAAGADLETAGYAIIPAAPEAGDAMVLPRRIMNEDPKGWSSYVKPSGAAANDATVLDIGSNYYAYECNYYVTENGDGADSITWIPFAERIDTLFKYLEKAPDASWEIDWVDGVVRADLKEGDILKVTNGSVTEEYYLSLKPLEKGSIASLSAITWPDVNKEDTGWDSDTIPGFSSNIYQYNVEIPYGSTNIPALSFVKEDVNAMVEVQSAANIRGGIDDRTTTITVTSADAGVVNEYRIIFNAEVRPTDMQPYFAEPIVTEFIWVLWWSASFVEISNVGNQPLDLGKYLLGGGGETPANFITRPLDSDSASSWRGRYRKYIPGKKYSDYPYWADNHVGMVVDDPDILPIIEPGECFVIAWFRTANHTTPGDARYFDPSMYNVLFSNVVENQWGEVDYQGPKAFKYIFKIEGDSILDGLKAMGDPEDFLLLDVYGDNGDPGAFGGEIDGVGASNPMNHTFRRKPSNYLPQTSPTVNTGQTAEEHSWYVLNPSLLDPSIGGDRVKYLTSDIGNFTHDPITLYMSTVSSIAYLVDDGYKTEDGLKIKGVVAGTTSASFIENLIPKDVDQGLSVISSTSGLVLGDDDQLAAGDTLRVISKDGENITKYTVELGALDSNATLVSTEYTVNIDGADGTVSGIPMDISIQDVLDNVEVPALAVLNIIDAAGNLVPLQVMDMSDSTYRKTMVMGDISFEVTAQDGTTITYLLDQGILSSDAWVTSNVYTVNQENLTIADILKETTVDILLSNLIPAGNATMMIADKAAFKRDSGYVAMDDIVIVTSEDGTQTEVYSLRSLGYVASSAAWVTSSVYTVTLSSVDEIPVNTDVSEFLTNIEIPGGAYLKLMDDTGAEKESGTILGTDQLEVTSEDLSTVVVYTLNLLVSVHDWAMADMKVYPNPVSDLLHIEGLEGSCQIELTSMSGQILKAVQTSDPVCELSVSYLSAGMYILRVTDSHLNVKVMRVIKSE